MSAIPGERLKQLCEALFERVMPSGHIIDNTIVALCPDNHSVYRIFRTNGLYEVFYRVFWTPSGNDYERGWYSTSQNHINAQQNEIDTGIQPPPEALLKGLEKALPLPSGRAWGVVEADEIVEMIIFDRRNIVTPPSALFVVIQDRQSHNLRSQLYRDEWLSNAAFWEEVSAGRLVCLAPQVQNAQTLQWGLSSNGATCVVIDGVVLAQPAVWEHNATLTVADLQGIKDMPRS